MLVLLVLQSITWWSRLVLNLGELISGVGAVIGGELDLVETKIIAKRSYKWFFEHDFSVNKKDNEEEIEVYESDYEEVPKE